MEASGELCRRSIVAARRLGDKRLEAMALAWLSGMTKVLENDDEALRLGRESLAIARKTGDPYVVGRALEGLAYALPTPEERVPLYEEGLALFRSIGNLNWSIAMLNFLSKMNLETVDDVARNRKIAEEAVAVAEELGANWALPGVWGDLAEWCGVLGDLNPARTYARQSIGAIRRNGKPDWHQQFNLLTLSWCSAAEGDFELAAKLEGPARHCNSALPNTQGSVTPRRRSSGRPRTAPASSMPWAPTRPSGTRRSGGPSPSIRSSILPWDGRDASASPKSTSPRRRVGLQLSFEQVVNLASSGPTPRRSGEPMLIVVAMLEENHGFGVVNSSNWTAVSPIALVQLVENITGGEILWPKSPAQETTVERLYPEGCS